MQRHPTCSKRRTSALDRTRRNNSPASAPSRPFRYRVRKPPDSRRRRRSNRPTNRLKHSRGLRDFSSPRRSNTRSKNPSQIRPDCSGRAERRPLFRGVRSPSHRRAQHSLRGFCSRRSNACLSPKYCLCSQTANPKAAFPKRARRACRNCAHSRFPRPPLRLL